VNDARFANITGLTRSEVLSLANARARREAGGEELPPGGTSLDLVLQIARFRPGQDVHWHESDPNQVVRGKYVNRGEVQEVKLVGFPELPPGRLAIGYEVAFPGPEGVGLENHDVLEPDLRAC
jgi:hypothetical protein